MLLEVALWTIVVLANTSVDFFFVEVPHGRASFDCHNPRYRESGSSNVEMITFVNININCDMKRVFCSSVLFKMILIVAFLNDLLCFPPKPSAFI